MKSVHSYTLNNTIPEQLDRRSILPFFVVLILYILLRSYVWNQHFLLEDNDSVSYLSKANTFLNMDFQKIHNAGVDTTPFYPFFSALFSLPGWSIETGARLCSMFFSSVLYFALVMIGTRMAGRGGVLIGLLVLAFSPIMISLSFSVLTEPSYIATVYLGIALYMIYFRDSGSSIAIVLGVIFGLAFLNRTEGIIYLALIPFFHISQCLFSRSSPLDFKKVFRFNVLYIISFLVVIAPQIYHVSTKMGRLSLNGREVWMLILQQPDGRSYEEKIYGLDYSEGEINRKYIQKHPEVQKRLYSNISGNFKRYIKNILREFERLYTTQLGILIGPLGFVFFAFGISDLYRRHRFYEIFLFLLFIVASLVPPLMHDVDMRHIVVIAPISMLIAGIGVMYASECLAASLNRNYMKYLISVLFFLMVLMPSARPMYKMYQNEHAFDPVDQYYHNRENYQEAVSLIKRITENELKRKPVIISRLPHISFYSDGDSMFMPFTDYEGLVRYSELNNADFLFLQHKYLRKHPFLTKFMEKTPKYFNKIYEGRDFEGNRIELYRLAKRRK